MREWLRRTLQDQRYFLIALVLISFTLRLAGALLTYGTEDVTSWEIVGETLLEGQNPYQYTHFLRWPPLWMMIIFVIKHLSLFFDVRFVTLIKAPPIIADTIIAVVIYYYFVNKYEAVSKGRLYAILYAINPISILIASIHGQFDSIPALFPVLSLYFVEGYKEVSDQKFTN
jgi:Gpi18-like mannosyltransferase